MASKPVNFLKTNLIQAVQICQRHKRAAAKEALHAEGEIDHRINYQPAHTERASLCLVLV